MNNKIVRISVVVLIVLGLVTIGVVWRSWASTPVLLSEGEVVQGVLAEYPGEVMSTSLENDAYVVQVQMVKGLYELRVDADGGAITSIKRLEAVVPDVIEPTKKPTTDTDKGSTAVVTRDEAIAISLKQVPGTVEEVEFRGKHESGYYLVEIDTDDGREAVVQVNGITGVIMSVTWDDDDDKDSHND
ncbi:PepSY domain-containing protein [Paenibacillus sp. FA6]|uniref:PepSY domain-containing protein n=1 Tax=Paenibacillus sp. FA6 TaxID=3413029 RepID=UPI003F65C35E